MSMPAARTSGKVPSRPLLHPVEDELRRIEEVLHAELDSPVRTIFDVSTHILDAGGKRLRPSLVVLSCRACRNDCDFDRVINVAASVELIHMATLMHDDVIDGTESRRGRVTANSFWGNQVSVLTGDYMLAKATSLLARDGDIRIIQALSRATIAMTEGEISQIESQGDVKALAADYLSIIGNKTAELMSACCRIAAILAAGPPSVEEALARYGLNFGLAFQITDDLLDLVGNPVQTGKPIGTDIREGKVTMPIILALEKASPANRAALETLIANDGATSDDIELVRQLVENTGAVEGTREVAAGYIRQAIDSLDPLRSSDARDSLEELAHYILQRKN